MRIFLDSTLNLSGCAGKEKELTKRLNGEGFRVPLGPTENLSLSIILLKKQQDAPSV